MHLRVAALPRSRIEVSAFHWLSALAVVEVCVFTLFGSVNRDEGWYLYASRLVYQGKLPYRDFAYFQPPVLPYIYGLPQWLFGPSLLVGRMTSLALVLATIVLLVRTARVLAGPSAVNWALVLVCLNPTLMYFGTLARSEAITTFLCSAALLSFFVCKRGVPALLFAPGALLLASGVRIAVLPAFLVATAFIWWRTPATRRERILAVGVLTGGLALIALPVLLAPQRAMFDVWVSQVSRSHQWAPSAGSVDQIGALIARLRDIQTLWVFFLVLLLPVAALLADLTLRAGRGWRPRWRGESDELTNYLVLIGFAALLLVPYVGVSPFEPRYFLPSAACMTVLLAAAAVRLPVSRGLEELRPFFTRMLLIVFVMATPFYLAQSELFLRFRQPDLTQSRDVGQELAPLLGSGDQLMTFDTTLALEANRPIMPRLEMAQFSYWPEMATASAESNGVMNKNQFREAIRMGVPKVIALTDIDLFILALDMHSSAAGASSSPEPAVALLPELAEHYTLQDTVRSYGQFRDKLYIYVRTTPETATDPAR